MSTDWRSRAQTRVEAKGGPSNKVLCPDCQRPMTLRSSQRGQFWGCSFFPSCRGTRKVGEEQKDIPAAGAGYEPMVKMPGSDEQEAIWECLANDTPNIMVDSGPGSGKTWVAVQWCLRASKTQQITIVAFNRHIAKEVNGKLRASKIGNAVGRTYHSLGYGILREHFKTLGDPNESKMKSVFEGLCPPPLFGKGPWRMKLNLAEKLSTMVKNYLIDYRASTFRDEMERLADHHGLDFNGDLDEALALVPAAMDKCKQMASTSIDYDDMIWLPIVLNLKPRFSPSLMITDEVQDLSAAQHDLMFRAGASRLMAIGDKRQCQPKGTLVFKTGVGYVPIETIQVGDQLATYWAGDLPGLHTQGRKVLEIASRNYDGKMFRIKAGRYQHECTPEHRCLVRMVKKNGWAVYVCKRGEHARVGTTKSLKNPAQSVGSRARQEHADAAWILAIFDRREDACLLENQVAYKYGIPQVIFRKIWKTKTKVHSQNWLDAFWKGFSPNIDKLKTCLRDFGRDYQFPFWWKAPPETGGEKRGALYPFVTQTCNLIDGWMRVCTTDGKRRAVKNSDWQVVKTESFPYHGKVYGVKLDKRWRGEPVYIAQGIVTHNSIYGWRGAMTASIDQLTARMEATPRGVKTFPLTLTRRCPKSHVRLAQNLFPNIQALPDAPEGEVLSMTKEKAVEMMTVGDLVVCRVNAELIGVAYALIRRKIRPVIKGKDIGKGLRALIDKLEERAVQRLDAIARAQYADELAIIREELGLYGREEAERLLKLEEKGEGRMQNLMDKCACMMEFIANAKTVQEIRENLEALFKDDDESNAVVLGTIHRTKGLEANRVFVLAPELLPHPMARKQWEREQERNCCWIAATRAKFDRDHPGTLIFCGPVPAIFGGAPSAPPTTPTGPVETHGIQPDIAPVAESSGFDSRQAPPDLKEESNECPF